MALNHRARAADWLVAGYNVLLGIIWTAFWAEAGYARWIALAHFAAATLPIAYARVARRGWGFFAALREIYPLVFLLAFWPEMDVLRGVLGPGDNDALIARLDLASFGLNLHAVWLPAMDAVWFSESMYFAYYAYYPLIFLPPLVLAFQGRRVALRDLTFRLMAAYLSCYLVYIVFPVLGPHYASVRYQGLHTQGFFYGLVEAAQAFGDSRGCAFPSSHVAGSVTMAVVGWRWFSRPVAVLLSLETVGVVLSTVYTQNHYAIDSLVGLIWGLALQLAIVPAMQRALRHRPERAPLPMLPDFGGLIPSPRVAGGGG